MLDVFAVGFRGPLAALLYVPKDGVAAGKCVAFGFGFGWCEAGLWRIIYDPANYI